MDTNPQTPEGLQLFAAAAQTLSPAIKKNLKDTLVCDLQRRAKAAGYTLTPHRTKIHRIDGENQWRAVCEDCLGFDIDAKTHTQAISEASEHSRTQWTLAEEVTGDE